MTWFMNSPIYINTKKSLYTIYHILHTIYHILYIIYYILHTIYYIPYTTHHILYTIYYILYSTPLLWYIKGNIPLIKVGISGDIPQIIGISEVYQTNLDIPLDILIYLWYTLYMIFLISKSKILVLSTKSGISQSFWS